MIMNSKTKKTITDNTVDPDILTYTVGDDPVLDLNLAVWDCMGTAAHVTMLSEMKLKTPVVSKAEAASVRRALGEIVKEIGALDLRAGEDDELEKELSLLTAYDISK
jgi:argininosuccinate lyase